MAEAPQNWQNDLKSWTERNFFLLNNEFMSDCSFMVQDGENQVKLPAHKYILGASSWEFYNLFFLMEAGSTEIPVNDVSVESVKLFLQFMYKEAVQLNKNVVWDVLKLAHRYSVNRLKIVCGQFLSGQIAENDTIKLFEKSVEYNLENLSQRCLLEISKNTSFFESEAFLEIKKEAIVHLLKSDELHKNELDIYNGVYRWAKHNCEKTHQEVNIENIRSVLGDVWKFIRFGAMSSAEFTKCVDESPILESKEIIQIFKGIGDSKYPCEFSRMKRELYGVKDWILSGIKSDNQCKFVCSQVCSIVPLDLFQLSFSTNKPIMLNGCYTYGCNINKYNFNPFDITLQSAGKLMARLEDCSLSKDNKDYPGLHKFKSSIYVEPNRKYTITIHGLKKNDNFDCVQMVKNNQERSHGVIFKKIRSPTSTEFSFVAGLSFTC